MSLATRKIHEALIASGKMQAETPPVVAEPAAFTPLTPATRISTADADTIRVRCIGARGDVLQACAVAGALKHKFSSHRIVLETANPDVARGNPYIDSILSQGEPLGEKERLVDLRPEAEWRPREHRLARMCEVAEIGLGDLRFFMRRESVSGLPERYVVLHAGPTGDLSWKGRNWLPERWSELAARIVADGLEIVVVGDNAAIPFPPGMIDLRDKTTLYQTAFIVERAAALVGIESFPAIIAQAFGVPSALFFGSILPELRVFRDNVIAVSDTRLSCLGCHHDTESPVITGRCKIGGEPCQENVSVGDVLSAVREAVTLPRADRVKIYRRPMVRLREKPSIRPLLKRPAGTIAVLRRWSTAGDVLVASSVAAAVRKAHPSSRIIFETNYPALFKGHPFVDQVVEPEWKGQCDHDGNMRSACEAFPYMNMLAAYAARCGVSPDDCEFWLHTDSIKVPDEYVVMHAGPVGTSARKWAGREWFQGRFAEIANRLADRGLKTVLVGDFPRDPDETNWNAIDLRGRTTVYQLGHVIRHAKMFVGVDSFPFHVAQAFCIPGVAFFGCVLPELRIYRANMTGVNASFLPCIGCHHEKRPVYPEDPETQVCRIGFEHCRNAVTVELFWEAIEHKIGELSWPKPSSPQSAEEKRDGTSDMHPKPRRASTSVAATIRSSRRSDNGAKIRATRRL